MKRIEEMDFIDDCLHKLMVVARIGVEEGKITKDEIAEYITKRANKTFCSVFDLNLAAFGMMCMVELFKDKTQDDVIEMLQEGEDEEV